MWIKTNARAVGVAIRRFGRSITKATRKSLSIWAQETATAVKRVAPQSKGRNENGKIIRRTTNLRRSIMGRGVMVGGVATAVIRAPVMYAVFVEFGTKPHKIFPRRRKCLKWIGVKGSATPLLPMYRKVGGVKTHVGTRFGKAQNVYGYNFARYVNHPGTKPHPFFFGTIKTRYKYLPRDVRRALKEQARSIGNTGFILTG